MSKAPISRTTSFGTQSGLTTRSITRWPPEETVPWVYGPWSTPSIHSLGSRVESLLVSQGNPAPYGKRPQNGGAFLQKTFEYRHKPARTDYAEYVDAALRYENRGYLMPSWPVLGSADGRTWTAIQALMVPMGSTGWNRFSPGKPLASLSQFLGELRQLPKNPFRMAGQLVRDMRRAGSKTAGADLLRRSVGDHYLNYSFGWRPFLSDLEKLANFNENLFRTLDQLYRDHGRVVRRRGTISSTSNTTRFIDYSGSTAGYMPQLLTRKGGGSQRTVTTITTERFWFSAGFQYRMPDVNDQEAMSRLRQYLQGGGISPSVVWELTPWSWLADYYTNIGDVLENWDRSRAINLAAKYAYVMYKRDVSVVSLHEHWAEDGSFRHSASTVSRTITQARLGASAYGFGFTSGSLNNSQIANLVALGMSRRI